MKAFVAAVGLAAVCLAAPASGQISMQQIEARQSPALASCLERDSSTAGMRECLGTEYRLQDRALNQAYQAALGRLNARQQAQLRTAQRAWVAYRQARCRSMTDQDWGTLSLLAADDCGVSMTIARTIELEDYPPN